MIFDESKSEIEKTGAVDRLYLLRSDSVMKIFRPNNKWNKVSQK